ncbi:hypothetical protein [Bacillus sp. Marseille-P3661]|nr:hypothetical protein [Bacillus sp. Marseille-P3661]
MKDLSMEYQKSEQNQEYDLRPQLKPSAAFNREEKSKFVSEQIVKNYGV